MSPLTMQAPAESGTPARVLARISSPEPGPLLLVTAGLHGNEPAGIHAVRRVVARMAEHGIALRGDLVALAGNIPALEARQRYISRDMNRLWDPERVAAWRRGEQHEPEDTQSAELADALEQAIASARGPAFHIDLHTTSAHGVPFAFFGDTLRNRDFALKFPVAFVLGLEELVDGTLVEFVSRLGPVTIGFEAGQHDAPESVDNAEAMLWVALVAAGLVRVADLPFYHQMHQRLVTAAGNVPRMMEVVHRHAIAPGDEYRMKPGYTNFDPVREGEVVAEDRHGPVTCPRDGLMLMPLYQAKGNDGYFLARPINRFWLWVSRMLRYLGAGRVAHWLPGVSRDPERPGQLLVDPAIARFFVYDVFHLLGYRRERPRGEMLVVSRRPENPGPGA